MSYLNKNGNEITVNGSELVRIIPLNNDFIVDLRFDCKVVLSDIYSEGLTGKSNLLKFNQDKTHSALSQKSADKLFLETLKRKDRIIWPPSSSVNELTNLDDLMMNELLQLPSNLSIQDKVDCLESSIYNKASDLFGFVPPPKKRRGGKNRRVNNSINLVIKKNLLLKELESVGDPKKRVELLGLWKV